MEKISAVIITFNEEEKLLSCIRSLRPVADEIIVLDSFSTDRTVSIAKKAGVTVYQQHFTGYKEQKNAALQLTSHNYVLSLDADEALSVELINSILSEKEKPACRAYTMNRSNFYCGRFIKHGLWYPDKKLRLFDKRIARWGGVNPHDKIVLTEPSAICHLKGDLLHYGYNSVEEHARRNEEITNISARSMFEAGVNISWYKIIFSPIWRFIKGYFFKLGFLDGSYGFVIAKQTAYQSYLKYKKLARLQKFSQTKNQQSYFSESLPVSFSDK